MILIAYDGSPTLSVRLTDVREMIFGNITLEDMSNDGSPVCDLTVWIPLHGLLE
jgi:hypothetical protein